MSSETFDALLERYQTERNRADRLQKQNNELMAEAQEAQKLREILTNLLKKHHSHSGACCVFDTDTVGGSQKIIINEHSCRCSPEEKRAYSALGWPRLWK